MVLISSQKLRRFGHLARRTSATRRGTTRTSVNGNCIRFTPAGRQNQHIGPAEVEVSVRVKTPLYLSKQRGQIEHEKTVLRWVRYDTMTQVLWVL